MNPGEGCVGWSAEHGTQARRTHAVALRFSRTRSAATAAAGRISRRGRAARGRPEPLPQLRALGDHLARAARRARRPEAGAAPHPLHDVAAEPDGRCQAPQVRQGGGRRDGQLPSPRRRGALRDAGPHGAAVLAALPAGGRLRELRIARWRQRRRHALHRVPPGARVRRDAGRDRPADRPLPPQLRRHPHRAGGAAGAAAEPARQRHHRHRGRHGHQRAAAQPGRGVHGAPEAPGQPRPRQRGAVPLGEGAGLSDRRPDPQLRRGAEGDLQDRRGDHPPARDVGGRAWLEGQPDALRHQHPLRREQVDAGRADRRRGAVEKAAAAARRQGRVDRRRPHRPRIEARRRPAHGHGVSLQEHAAPDQRHRQPDVPDSRPRTPRSAGRSGWT